MIKATITLTPEVRESLNTLLHESRLQAMEAIQNWQRQRLAEMRQGCAAYYALSKIREAQQMRPSYAVEWDEEAQEFRIKVPRQK